MPPPESNKRLSADEKRLLRQWIADGATYQGHWAYERPVRPSTEGFAPERSPIDGLIDRELGRLGIAASPPADRLTLLRRVYLDLIGLPPPPTVSQRVADDASPNWYENVVEELLASPHFGERMAIDWLDVARYADTVGYHGDQNQNVYPYRDWVIEAFNRNLPFDRFTEYQLAGDLIEVPTVESRTASCFNRLNMMTREGGAQPREYLVKYAADRVRTVAGAWLGSTIGCAECHDHKFDPFTAHDFYSMAAFFADLRQWGVYQDYPYTPNPDLKGWSNDHPFPPEIVVDVPYLQRRIADLHAAVDARSVAAWRAAGNDAELASDRDQWLSELTRFLDSSNDGWQAFRPTVAVDDQGATREIQMDSGGAILLDASGGSLVLRGDYDGAPICLLLELLAENPGEERVFPGRGTAARLQVSLAIVDSQGQRRSALVHFAHSQHVQPRYASTHEILGVADGWLMPAAVSSTASAVWQLAAALPAGGSTLEVRLAGDLPKRFRLWLSPMVPRDLRQPLAWQGLFDGIRSGAISDAVETFVARQWLLTRSSNERDRRELLDLEQQIIQCRDGRAPVQVSESGERMVTRVLPRGNWQDESGEVVTAAVPAFLPQTSLPADRLLDRRDLARWLTSEENPLTARVQMNRLWKHFFGSGLSPVPDDFGMQGQFPSHPELLDWLAVEFRESGWDFKHMVRQIVLSDVYRRSAVPTDSAAELDPKNVWLGRQNARRLEAEIVRDNALAISGLINLDLGGPPVFPYQPDHYYENLQFPDRRYVADRGDRQYRRGVYMHWQRTFLHPMLAAFDAPSREECTAVRTQANTPLQALVLLNDPSLVEAAVQLADRACSADLAGDAQRIDWLYWQTLSRPALSSESESLARFVAAERQRFTADPDSARKLLSALVAEGAPPSDFVERAAWTSVARAMLNLHETITRF
jgi:hypothetical protein